MTDQEIQEKLKYHPLPWRVAMMGDPGGLLSHYIGDAAGKRVLEGSEHFEVDYAGLDRPLKEIVARALALSDPKSKRPFRMNQTVMVEGMNSELFEVVGINQPERTLLLLGDWSQIGHAPAASWHPMEKAFHTKHVIDR